MVKTNDCSPPVKKATTGFFKNMMVNPVQANTSNMTNTCVADTPHLVCNFSTQDFRCVLLMVLVL